MEDQHTIIHKVVSTQHPPKQYLQNLFWSFEKSTKGNPFIFLNYSKSDLLHMLKEVNISESSLPVTKCLCLLIQVYCTNDAQNRAKNLMEAQQIYNYIALQYSSIGLLLYYLWYIDFLILNDVPSAEKCYHTIEQTLLQIDTWDQLSAAFSLHWNMFNVLSKHCAHIPNFEKLKTSHLLRALELATFVDSIDLQEDFFYYLIQQQYSQFERVMQLILLKSPNFCNDPFFHKIMRILSLKGKGEELANYLLEPKPKELLTTKTINNIFKSPSLVVKRFGLLKYSSSIDSIDCVLLALEKYYNYEAFLEKEDAELFTIYFVGWCLTNAYGSLHDTDFVSPTSISTFINYSSIAINNVFDKFQGEYITKLLIEGIVGMLEKQIELDEERLSESTLLTLVSFLVKQYTRLIMIWDKDRKVLEWSRKLQVYRDLSSHRISKLIEHDK